MAVTLTSNFIDKLKQGSNTPNVIVEFGFNTVVRWIADGSFLADGSITASGDDGGTDRTEKKGYSTGNFTDVVANLKSVSSLQNKIDAKGGFVTLGQISITLTGRDSFKDMVKDEFMKNRRVTRMDGFEGLAYSDYAGTFTGTIQKWSRKGDTLTIVVQDDLVSAKKKIPVEATDGNGNVTNTQFIDYRSTNPVDIMLDILKVQLAIPASQVDTTTFESERDTWLSGWTFDRVLRKPEEGLKLLNDLQIQTNTFIINDGEKISLKYFGPPVPGQIVPKWTDDNAILENSLSQRSGYDDNFYNRVVVYFDYNESGDDGTDAFDAAVEATDLDSQSAAEWDETNTKTIKAKDIRTLTYTQPVNINTTGDAVTIYQVARYNEAGTGTIAYTQATNTIRWTAPGGSAGEAVELTKDGVYQVFDADTTKSIRIIVDTTELPGTDQSDGITVTALQGANYAATLADKILQRYRDPVSEVTFDVDINHVARGTSFIKPTDLIDVTTDEAFEKGKDGWTNERLMITSTRPDFTGNKIGITAIKTGIPADNTIRYGFIAPTGFPDYPSATDAQREYAFIGTTVDNEVDTGIDGYYIY